MSSIHSDPIVYYHRYRQQLEEEAVYGEQWLRWAYGNPLGRLSVWALASRAWFSRRYGVSMARPASSARIRPFIEKYGLDISEFAGEVEDYKCFNDFFTRHLKPEARPVDSSPNTVVFPADGRHLGFACADEVSGVFVKGQRWNLEALLGSAELAQRYAKGALVLSRLCPVDYHHFHFVAAGVPGEARRIEGRLYSVSPLALRRRLDYLWKNDRRVTVLQTDAYGEVLQLEIGATNVGSIVQDYVPGVRVIKGSRKGWFAFGGSSVITLFLPGSVRLAEDLCYHSAQGHELYARMGDVMGNRL